MEKIITKIGDVTIQRRVAKQPPQQAVQQQPGPKAPTEVPASNIPQQPKNLPPKTKPEEQTRLNHSPGTSFPNAPRLKRAPTGDPDLTSPRSKKQTPPDCKINFPKGISVESLKAQESSQKLDNRFQKEKIVFPSAKPDVSKVIKTTPVKNPATPLKQDQNPRKEPDLSKFTGISIERQKKETPLPLNIPGVNIQRFPAKDRPEFSENEPDDEDYEEDYEDQPFDDDEDFDLPEEAYENYQTYQEERRKAMLAAAVAKPVQFPNNPSNQPAKSPSNPVLDKFKQSGLMIEKRKLPEVAKKPAVGNWNIPGIDIQRLSKAKPKSPHLSSEDEEKPVDEDFESDVKDGEDFDEDFEAESEEFEEETAANVSGMQKQQVYPAERRIDVAEAPKEHKPGFQNKSPIVLSSEDDERLDEEEVEKPISNYQHDEEEEEEEEEEYEEDLDEMDEQIDSEKEKSFQEKQKTPNISNFELEQFAKRSGITIEKKNAFGEAEESENEEEGYGDMEGEGEYDEMEDENFEIPKTELKDEEKPEPYDLSEMKVEKQSVKVEPFKKDEVYDEEEEEEEEEEGSSKNSEEEGKEPEEEAKDEGDIGDLEYKDLVELMQKGEIEGEIEDDKDEEAKDENKRKAEDDEEGEEGEGDGDQEEGKEPKSKKKKSGEESEEEEKEGEDGEGKNIDKSKISSTNLRKNIREVMDETKLDESTLAAQRQEAERLKRLQDQQRMIRDVQKQITITKQSQKTQQSRVLSLLQGNSQTSILKTSSLAPPSTSAQTKAPNHVLLKMSNGQQTSLNKMKELLKTSHDKPTIGKPAIPKTLLKQGMVTPSVSIAPVKREPVAAEAKKKKGDVVTLSSDSEDDCVVLSDEEESETEDDPTNSGMHTMDKYNVPDEQGRVIVNVGHPEADSDLFLAPQIARVIKPHQVGGIRFLYDNVIESIERYQSSAGFGCILAHSMGLGKTLQIVSFSDIFLRYTPARTILCIMPINTIQNWLAEFNMWLPKENKTDLEVRCREFDLFIVNESLKNINTRAKVILEWQKNGGVLLMGYELFRLLSLKKSYKSKKKKKEGEEKEKEDEKTKELIEEVYAALVAPGPDLVICDEGHRIKNSHATTSQALKQIRTKRRIVLTGYPLQNNLLEYWCMVDFVRPNYLGSKTEFSNMFERPIQNGQCIDSTPEDKRLMRFRAHVLHSLLEGFVQRRSHAVLQSTLPDKEEYVLLLRFTSFQRKLYDTFMNEVVRTVAVPNPLKAFAVCCKIWNHPDVLYNFLRKKGEEIDLDLEEVLPPSMQPPGFPYGQGPTPEQSKNFNPLPPVAPWPRRGPGSRGGKVRQPCSSRRVGRGGRKPAASIAPNLANQGGDKGPRDGESFNSGHFPSTGSNFTGHERVGENFPGRSYPQNQFSSSGFQNEYPNQSTFQSGGNFNKNPLDNLEDLSTGNFPGKRFYPQNQHQSDNSTQTPFTTPNRNPNFDSNQNEGNFGQNINSSNDSNLNASFDSNLNSNDSSYNQNEPTKSFEFNPDFNSEFFGGSNFQNSETNTNYQSENPPGYHDEGGSNSSTYFQGSNAGSAAFDYSQNSNFQGFEGTGNNTASNYQGSSAGTSQSGNMAPNFSGTGSGSDFPSSNFQGPSGNFPCADGSSTGSFQGNNPNYMERTSCQQGYWSGGNWGSCNFPDAKGGGGSAGNQEFLSPHKYQGGFESADVKTETKPFAGSGNSSGASGGVYTKTSCDFGSSYNAESENNFRYDEKKPAKEETEDNKADVKTFEVKKEDPSMPYDWAVELFKNYVTGVVENSSKMEVFMHIVTESIKLGDRILVFSQSLLTLDLIENYLHCRSVPNKEETWAKHRNYFRLDGSTPGLEREKLINEFNANPNIHLFLVSTRAGSLGINLVGANRVVVFDASWNPCHDTQAVCRVYRYGQRKPCFVYRLVMDSCLEKKIYDRQINKQGMADRVVDELNPDAHLSIKEVTNLCWDDQEDTTVQDFSHLKEKYRDEIIKLLLQRCSQVLSKEPFQHESLLIDRKEKKLSQAEKRLAKRYYELEKSKASQPKNMYTIYPNLVNARNLGKPIASVRPMQSESGMSRVSNINPPRGTKWIPIEVWQRQGVAAEEMTLPRDVVIPTNSPDKTSVVLKTGQRVIILRSTKGIYMQLENGKIIAVRSVKTGHNGPNPTPKIDEARKDGSIPISSALKNNPNLTITQTQKSSGTIRLGGTKQPFLKPFAKPVDKKLPVNINAARSRQVMGKAKPFVLNRKFQAVTPEIQQRLMSGKPGPEEKSNAAERPTEQTEGSDSVTKEKVSEKALDVPEEKTSEKLENLQEDNLETLRKVTQKISEEAKTDESRSDPKNSQVDSLKKYRHNFGSHFKNQSQGTEGDSSSKDVSESETEGEVAKAEEESAPTQQGNENVQNWLMNQSYPPMDPYGNYFPPQYYGYGPGPAPPMMPPFDGFYPGNYGHPMGRNSPMVHPNVKQEPSADNVKTAATPTQPLPNPNVQNVQNSSAPRNSPVLGNPPMYPPYPNPYPYPYNYPGNPGFNNQGYPFPNQSQSSNQNSPVTTVTGSTTTTTTNTNPTPNPTPNPNAGQNPPNPYDNSMYSAFHRPDSHFQGPESPYPPPYPRPPYPNTPGTPGFFPYNAPYRPYPDPNYAYGHNFSPYMHPPGYGYPMQNPPPINPPQSAAPTSSDGNNSSNH